MVAKPKFRRELTEAEIQDGAEDLPCGCSVSVSQGKSRILRPCHHIESYLSAAHDMAAKAAAKFMGLQGVSQGERDALSAAERWLSQHIRDGRREKGRAQAISAVAAKQKEMALR